MHAAKAYHASFPQSEFSTLKQLADAFLQRRTPAPLVPVISAPALSVGVSPIGTVMVDDAGRVAGIDKLAEQLLGRASAEVVALPVTALFNTHIEDALETAIASYQELLLLDKTIYPLWVAIASLTFDSRSFRVITLYENNLMSQQRSELRYQNLVEQVPAVVFTAALDGGVYDIYVSPQIENLLGYSQSEWLANPVLWYERLYPEDRHKLDQEFARGCATGGPFKAEIRFVARDNQIVWVHGEARLITNAQGLPLLLQGVAFDISETKRAEVMVRNSLKEKETLLKEIHHRVKNNLQVTSSLLKLQASRIGDAAAQQALHESQNRIRSMALVHEVLYRSKDLSCVDLAAYVRDLIRQLWRSYAVEPSQIRVETDLEPVQLSVETAVPCGLILNELVSNALKYAFPQGRSGTIYIGLHRQRTYEELIVRDDGIGLRSDIEGHAVDAADATLGLQLIRTLTDQVGGTLTIQSQSGTEVRLTIPRYPAGGKQ